ncbi:Similar to hypothetical protein [Tuber melanosporum Mel28]; acc. no. XP_002838703 [Pyronema omphalodes CBS 100304]|uniref:TM7S3/TM198-like domain-containing protein n=1 Tax=Pyronema omphalodes (strain CBS 100304) TaxID=1076935 RepID=U4L7Y6_PYROM|nr:Similar to hypothetical protein [Tuber melanosporum Mel28]; acc. no. XP_002838703 [Pyronema omphalodes CBS 100304]
MRPTRISLLFCAFVALCFSLHLVEGGKTQGLPRRDARLLPRQTDTRNSRTPTITDIPNTTGATESKTTSDGSQRPSGTGKNKDISSPGPAPTATDAFGSNDVSSLMGGKVYSGYGLPYEPRVTPGLGVAGVFLMIAGLGCCFIGIKIKRLHIFFSMAYLSGLSVTVLIVYVMNPPVRDAIEGAYVVAVIITGAILGALAVVFPEVTEGLGCLLGGFCLSMWFLVLKPGGLITSIYGKLTMIGTFCLVIFALAFHERTRPWGLITSLSFSGATSIMLGIDCFSRAGLKEFWLYIWALNDKIFPLQTNTFPHTRGMKVEIAGIIILFAVGVMSQMKLWKIIQARREAKNMIKRQHQANLEAIDEESGKRVEAENMVERERWEAAYGNQKETNTNTNTNDQDANNVRPQTGASKTDSGLGREEARKKEEEDTEVPELAEGTVDASVDKAIDGEMETVKNDEAQEGLQPLGTSLSGAGALEAGPIEALTADEAENLKLRSTYTSVVSPSPANDTVDESTPNTTPDITPNNTPPPPSKDESVQQAPSLLPQDLVPASYPRSKTSSSSVSRHEIQTQCSRIVKTYRTNEWAKHLAEADKPDPKELILNPVEIEVEEKAAPLNFNELGGTTTTAPQAPSRRSSNLSKEASRDALRDSTSTPTVLPRSRPFDKKSISPSKAPY